MVKLIFGGAILEPRAYGLLMLYMRTLKDADLEDLIGPLQNRLFRGGRALRRERTTAGPIWRLTDWGELTVLEIVSIANRVDDPLEVRRQAIEQALTFAGFDESETPA